MKYLRGINESHSDKNEAYYIINDILLEFFDEIGIQPLPERDTVESYEDYLTDNPMAYGYYLESPQFDASRHETKEEIKSLALFNINKDRVYKTIKYIESQQDRIKDSTGYNVSLYDEELDSERYDIYISLMDSKEYLRKLLSDKISSYTHKIENLSLDKLSDDKLKEALLLLDKLFEITK